jgi:hypothetical protein
VKTAIIALSAAALIAAAPAVYARDASIRTPRVQHNISKQHVSKKLHPGVSTYALRPEMQSTGWMRSYPGAFGYAPGAPKDYTYENSRNAGGGGGGGGGGGSGM